MNNELERGDKLYLNIQSMKTCLTKHSRDSYGLALNINHQNGQFKLAYSGDTASCTDFVELGRDCNLLIHEATYGKDMKKYAKKCNHSTVNIALKQSRQMKAKYTILTHFSSRYPVIPCYGKTLDNNAGIAFDFMEISPDDLPKLNSLYKKYNNAFTDINLQLYRNRSSMSSEKMKYIWDSEV